MRLANGRSEATQTRGAQPADGSASAVVSVVGFPPGSLVRLFQRNPSGDIEAYRVVQRVEARWAATWCGTRPLEVLPVVLAGFDLAAPIDLETLTFSLSVYENGRFRELYADLSIVPQGERYAPAVVNPPADPLQRRRQPLPLIEVEDLHAGVLPPAWQDWLPDVDAATADFAAGTLTLRCGANGLANLQALDFTGDPGASTTEATGLRVLELRRSLAGSYPGYHHPPCHAHLYDPLPQPEPDPCLDCPPLPGVLPLPPGPCPDIAEQPPVFSRPSGAVGAAAAGAALRAAGRPGGADRPARAGTGTGFRSQPGDGLAAAVRQQLRRPVLPVGACYRPAAPGRASGARHPAQRARRRSHCPHRSQRGGAQSARQRPAGVGAGLLPWR